MIEDSPVQDMDMLERQAHAWVRRLTSGSARPRDAQALQRWCATSQAHQRAFATAHRKWRDLGPAAQLAGESDAALAAVRAASRPARAASRAAIPRRAFLGGAMAAAAAAGVAVVHPPLGLWPSAQALQADYRTGTGEQRSLALAPGVTVEMNTRSSVALLPGEGAAPGIHLLEGEVAVDALGRTGSFVVAAGNGLAEAASASFEVRYVPEGVCVTCIEGLVRVALGTEQLVLAAAQQVTYGRALQPMRRVDTAAWSAWREGFLNFRGMGLAQVVEEINRYRPGRVILLDKAAGTKPVSGRFPLRDLDKAVSQIQRLFRLEATSLPGGIIVLS